MAIPQIAIPAPAKGEGLSALAAGQSVLGPAGNTNNALSLQAINY